MRGTKKAVFFVLLFKPHPSLTAERLERLQAGPARPGRIAREVQGFVNKRRKARARRQPIVQTTGTVAEAAGAVKDEVPLEWTKAALFRYDEGTNSYATAGRWFGCEKEADQFRCSIDKFKQLQKLYQPSRPLCKHEVAIHAARAISYGNWFPIK